MHRCAGGRSQRTLDPDNGLADAKLRRHEITRRYHDICRKLYARTLNTPQRGLTYRVVAMPADTNAYGDIFGGWLMSRVDIASILAIHVRPRAGWQPWR